MTVLLQLFQNALTIDFQQFLRRVLCGKLKSLVNLDPDIALGKELSFNLINFV